MKIAIHDRKNSFSKDWIEYCEENSIPYTLVDCYSNDIFQQMEDCDVLMWHWHHTDHAATLFARQLIYSFEKMGKKVFPNTNTCRFFDDKIGQRYLFESMDIPHVPTYIFYDKKKALEWVEKAEFPKVFKLSKGAGSANVRLVKSKKEAIKLVKRAFGKGFKPSAPYFSDISRKIKKKKTFSKIFEAILRAPKTIKIKTSINNQMNHEKGYVYFQNFIPGNISDTRIVVIGDKAFVKRRLCPQGDFRASSSKIEDFDETKIDKKCVEIAMNLSQKMEFQSMAYDFIFDNGTPLVVEMSYGFATPVYPGFYDQNYCWNYGEKEVYKEMVNVNSKSNTNEKNCIH